MKETWSFSKWSALRKCPHYYYLKYVEEVPEPGPQSSNLVFGTVLHSALNASLMKEDGQDVFRTYWESYRGKEIQYDRWGYEELMNLGLEFVRKFDKKYAPEMELLLGEQRIAEMFDGVMFDGQPDALVTYKGDNVLIDFKTTGYPYDKDKILNAAQLNLYAALIHSATTHNVHKIMYLPFVKSTGGIQTPLVAPFDDLAAHAMIQEMATDIHMHLETVRDDANPIRNPNACIMGKQKCPYFDRCWKGKK